jgi:hypothetical protein
MSCTVACVLLQLASAAAGAAAAAAVAAAADLDPLGPVHLLVGCLQLNTQVQVLFASSLTVGRYASLQLPMLLRVLLPEFFQHYHCLHKQALSQQHVRV